MKLTDLIVSEAHRGCDICGEKASGYWKRKNLWLCEEHLEQVKRKLKRFPMQTMMGDILDALVAKSDEEK